MLLPQLTQALQSAMQLGTQLPLTIALLAFVCVPLLLLAIVRN